jgi:hypothetical protein
VIGPQMYQKLSSFVVQMRKNMMSDEKIGMPCSYVTCGTRTYCLYVA